MASERLAQRLYLGGYGWIRLGGGTKLFVTRAVAVDLGAGSARFAIGELAEGKISFRIVRQIGHEARQLDGRLRWDFGKLLGFCKEAVSCAEAENASSLGIDSWGVDHGFLNKYGELIAEPVCYRDLSHLQAFESLAPFRNELYALTGIQHQPFNTICQFVARKAEQPSLITEAADWMILPDLLGYFLGGSRCSELTQASTTQLLGLDGEWSQGAFGIAGWPVPVRNLNRPGARVGVIGDKVELITVGSHDTASAVAGFGKLSSTDLFLNIGTWSLCGVVIPQCVASPEAEAFGFTNERAADGQVRFLKNIPGFYFINRLHSDLGVSQTVPEWLESAKGGGETVDLFDPEFFNPTSMLETCRERLKGSPEDLQGWAGLALDSLAEAVAVTRSQLLELTGYEAASIQVGGGGSQSSVLCQCLADRLGIPVTVRAAEATVLGNLAAQFLGQGVIASWDDAFEIIGRSFTGIQYRPS